MSQSTAVEQKKPVDQPRQPTNIIRLPEYVLAVVSGQVITQKIDRVRVDDRGAITLPQ